MVKQTDNTQKEDTPAYEETFSHDLDFLKKHKDVVLLEKDSMKVLIVPSYQARVMTSSSNGMNGLSYGWINYALIDSGKYQPQINAYGGEERLWLGPEGGQFALFFKKGQAFDFKNWQTPDVLDTVMFSLVSRGPSSASFTKSFDIVNYSGTKFNVKADREISLLEKNKAEELLGMPLPDVKWVGYETKNSIENTGDKDWNKSSGVLSIWLLSMMKASPDNTIIIPYKEGGDSLINDSYFGKIPAERLRKKDGIITFKADSKNRGKIGIPPSIVKPVAGSYDAKRNVLTILQFDYNGEKEYVNSMWEIQKFPYKGDVINAYNDGPNATGSQLGAFYEIESSSPAVPLKRNQKLTHLQRIFHFEGDKAQLDNIAKKILGTSINSL
jgi:hypothetical protein